MNIKIEEAKTNFKIPRYLAIIATKLNMSFQPSRRGSSMYRKPSAKKVLESQKDWKMPVGTLRLSDHWNFHKCNWESDEEKTIFATDIPVAKNTWVLAINTGQKPKPWKVLHVFTLQKGKNIIREIDCNKIQSEINLSQRAIR
ncbi:MAG: hypothetical protein UV20_C0040G0004 [Candidatus Magasanikbacteria bacterium GW2011_GWA2_42_32]|uniref:Uncharacterized protein n=1 Tax=Candidatus Magasanikbacteria bacterium GW2011_GWA2_42_32 TaxID=1619039 RepID=A0A0G1CWZ1_9BACT|nr:MAG: hypothetical protein UV20_C0040G0004 [Candidatus Magasanikbacteria bacterium GW2011_GWA2_42_32]